MIMAHSDIVGIAATLRTRCRVLSFWMFSSWSVPPSCSGLPAKIRICSGGLEALLVLDFLTFAASIETLDSTSSVIVLPVDVVGEELQALREHRLARQRSGRRRPHAFP